MLAAFRYYTQRCGQCLGLGEDAMGFLASSGCWKPEEFLFFEVYL